MQDRNENEHNLNQATILWQNANNMLENNNVEGYLHSTFRLHKFMIEKMLSADDLRPMLKDCVISGKGGAIIHDIWTYSSLYSTSATTSFETTASSMTNKLSAFFMDCKLELGVSPDVDSAFNLDKSKVLIGIMQFMPSLVMEIKEKGRLSLKAFMDYKITAIRGVENPDKVDAFDAILKSKGPVLAKHLSYEYATTKEGRSHALTATIDTFIDLKDKYKNIQGDALKTEILIHFKNELAEARNSEELSTIIKRLEKSDEYTVLKTQQGRVGRLFNLETSSIGAFNKMIQEAREVVLYKEQDNNFKP